MRRKLFILAAAVSLTLCAATVAMWVRSYRVSDMVGRVGETKFIVVNSTAGGLFVNVTAADLTYEEPGRRPYYFWNRGLIGALLEAESEGNLIHFGVHVESGVGWVAVPHWFLALPLSVLPVACARRHLRARRASQDGHARCGHDLPEN